MKKYLMVGAAALFLTACGETETTTNESEESVVTESIVSSNTVESESAVEETSENEVSESEFGKMTKYGEPKEINEMQQSGPINITVEAISKGMLEPSESYIDLFDGKEKLTVISVKFNVENTSDETIAIYPDQSTIVTNTKKQVDANMLLSDSVGGDYIGQVIKDGTVSFFFEDDPEDVVSFQLIVRGASDADYNSLSEDLTFDLTFD